MLAAAPLLALALTAGPAAGRVEALEERRRSETAAARLLAEQERSVFDTLAESEAALAGAVAEARRAEAARAEAEARLARAREEETSAQATLKARLAELRPRLEARARLGRTGELQVLLASSSLADLVKRRYLLDVILKRDVQLLGEAEAARDARERARAQRQEEAVKLAALAEAAVDAREQAAARREEREALLAALRSARELHERAAVEAGEQARRLGELVTQLPPRAVPAPSRAEGFAARRGHLPFPAAGPIRQGFGRVLNPRFNTVTVQNGLDIGAPAGAPVRAVAPGRVVHAGWFKGYGNLVIIDHGEGYHTLAAHLATMRTAVGEDVEVGTVIGTVGDTGSLEGPSLYFELREHGRPVDPRPWLGK
jgi:murein DD-endopeptidase MepM/ murein hydrolase activator NlpD